MKNASLKRFSFPDFWDASRREKNEFYNSVWNYARRTVEATGRHAEYLNGDQVQLFWHEHCEFCWDKFLTGLSICGYCTPDYKYWICEECFKDFKEDFEFAVVDE